MGRLKELLFSAQYMGLLLFGALVGFRFFMHSQQGLAQFNNGFEDAGDFL